MELSTASNVIPAELLRTALRRLRFFSLKHGDETGESGTDAILFTRTPDEPDQLSPCQQRRPADRPGRRAHR